jgi:hypothetical protein
MADCFYEQALIESKIKEEIMQLHKDVLKISYKMVKFWNIRRCAHTAIFSEPLMWQVHAIPWTAYGSQVKECVCPKQKTKRQNLNSLFILKVDQRLWSRHITYKISKDNF